jgi:hypothetical protein
MKWKLVLLVLPAAIAVLAAASPSPPLSRPQATEAEARRVAAELFRTIDEHRYASTCALLADGFFDEALVGRRLCALGLRIGFTGSRTFRVHIGRVRAEGGRAVVHAVVDGVPGRIVMVREGGSLRILRLDGP